MSDDEGGFIGLEALQALTGDELFEGMRVGRYPLPPFVAACGGRLVSAGGGKATLEAPMRDAAANFVGAAHGGWIATMLDTTMSFAGGSLLGRGEGATSIEFKVSFFRPVVARAMVRFDGEVQRRGRRVFFAQAWARAPEGEPVFAHATTACMILPIGGADGLAGTPRETPRKA